MNNEPVLLTERTDDVLTLTLNRPSRKNAVTTEVWTALNGTLAEVAAGRDRGRGVRAVILTGAGDAFCSGADISDAAGMDEFPDPSRDLRAINDTVARLHDLPVPTVAKVRGIAAGAGWNLALGCDLVVASPQARFCQIFSRRALSVDCGGSWLLPRIVGLQQAKRLAFLADTIGAEEALTLGLVTWIQPDDALDTFVSDLAGRLAAGAPMALAQSKTLLNNGFERTFGEALADEAKAQVVNLSGRDVIEAFAAFLEKRTPKFTGIWGSGR